MTLAHKIAKHLIATIDTDELASKVAEAIEYNIVDKVAEKIADEYTEEIVDAVMEAIDL